jgi:hypothetical protein
VRTRIFGAKPASAIFSGGNKQVRARPEVMRVLLAKRMKWWYSIVRCPLIDLKCKPARARRNCLRLMAKYPEIAEALKLTVVSLYT